MSNVSPADILKIYGKWIGSNNFIELVSEKQDISKRQAYRNIKKAWLNKEILKVTLPSRNVLYGLAEFGQPVNTESEESSSEYKELINELKIIGDLALSSIDLAWDKYAYFEGRLPPEIRKKVESYTLSIGDNDKHNDSVALKIITNYVAGVIHSHYRNLESEVSR